jgi:hypothetical protein
MRRRGWPWNSAPRLGLCNRALTAQTEMKFNIARQKLFALGLGQDEIAALPDEPESLLRRQNVRSPLFRARTAAASNPNAKLEIPNKRPTRILVSSLVSGTLPHDYQNKITDSRRHVLLHHRS